MNYIYSFKVNCMDGEDEFSEQGFVQGKNFGEIVDKVEAYYGDELVGLNVKIISDNELIIIPDKFSEVIEVVEKNAIW